MVIKWLLNQEKLPQINLLKIILFAFVLISPLLHCQDLGDKLRQPTKTLPKFITGVRGYIFMNNFDQSINSDDNIAFELNEKTILTGFNAYTSYNLLNGLSTGFGIGFEEFNEPKFQNIPVFWTLAINGGSFKDSIHTQIMLGSNFTGEKKKGAFFRFYFGYRFRVLKRLNMDLSLAYTFQNIYKSFENSNRTTNYYNFESAGLSFGFDIN